MRQTIPAHFDGEHIVLDEPVELEPNTELMVTVLTKDIAREEWLGLSRQRLQTTYNIGEEEYSSDLIKNQIPTMNDGEVVFIVLNSRESYQGS